MEWLLTRFGIALSLLAVSACTPKIGDSCSQSTDCSVQGNRVCDTSQPGGYCTTSSCSPNSCPDNAVCVTFDVAIPGCAYNDYDAPSRLAHTLCMAHCSQNSDCRGGYDCQNPALEPTWAARVIDDNYNQKVCIAPLPSIAPDFDAAAAVCLPNTSAVAADGGAADGGAADGGAADGGAAESGSAPDTGTSGDGSLDALDAQADGAADGGIDAPSGA